MKRIEKIEKAYHGGALKYMIELCSNFSFGFSGSQITYCSNIKEIYECTKHIAFCDSEVIKYY